MLRSVARLAIPLVGLFAVGLVPVDAASYAVGHTACDGPVCSLGPSHGVPCPIGQPAVGPNTKGQLNQHTLNGVSFDSPTDGWAVGQWSGTDSEGHGCTRTRHWNGTTWRNVSSPTPRLGGNLAAVTAISPTEAWAVGTTADGGEDIGEPLMEHWDGESWSIVDVGSDQATLHAVSALGPDDVWASGIVEDQQTGIYSALMMHWDGTSWSRQDVPSTGKYPTLLALAPISADDVWAVGSSPLIEHWDGQTWTRGPEFADTGYRLAGITALATNDVWAVGWIGSGYHVLTLHWDGSNWTRVAAPNGPQDSARLLSVSAVAPDDVWAVGTANNRLAGTKTLIEHWDGATWSRVASPNHTKLADHPNTLTSIAVLSSDEAWAVGSFGLTTYKYRSIIDRWDGHKWTNYPVNH